MYAWKFHRGDKFVIQSFTGGIRNFFRHSIYSRIPPVTDCITNNLFLLIQSCICYTMPHNHGVLELAERTSNFILLSFQFGVQQLIFVFRQGLGRLIPLWCSLSTIFQLYRCWSVLLVEETGVPGENHQPAASH